LNTTEPVKISCLYTDDEGISRSKTKTQLHELSRIDSPYFRRRFEIKPGERAVENTEINRDRIAVNIILFLYRKKKRE